MTIKDPLFTAEDVEVLHRKSRDILATDPFGSRDVRKIADRLQQWIDQQNGTRWENGRLVPALSYFRVADETDLPGKGL